MSQSSFVFATENLNTRLETSLARFESLSEKEGYLLQLSERVQRRVERLLTQGRKSPLLQDFLRNIQSKKEHFPIPGVDKVPLIHQALLDGKLSLEAIALSPTPVLYTGSFSSVFGWETGTWLLLDEYNQIDPLEFIALPGTVFRIEGVSVDRWNIIYQVTSDEYPYSTEKGYYTDARFLDVYWTPVSSLEDRKISLPTQEEIIATMRSNIGLPYIWGGNVPAWVPKLLEYYGPTSSADTQLRSKWTFRWVDCSGLLYYATNGYTPRNTSSLVSYGTGVAIADKTVEEIKKLLQPLDLLAWQWHTLIVIDNEQVIESKAQFPEGAIGFGDGVRIRSVDEVVTELLRTRVAVDSIADPVPEGKRKFVVRRWYGIQ